MPSQRKYHPDGVPLVLVNAVVDKTNRLLAYVIEGTR